MELVFERHYPHPIERVWEAISTSEALAAWLMPNDFEAEIGRTSVFHFCPSQGDEETLVHVMVLELEPPRHMQWRWRHEGEPGETTVAFDLEPTEDGTLLRLHHVGDASALLVDRLRQGWPEKLDALLSAVAP